MKSLPTKQLATIAASAPKKKVNAFGLHKVKADESKSRRVMYCLCRLSSLIEAFKIEYQTEMDAEYKDPLLNNLANRIAKDIKQMQAQLSRNPKLTFEVTNNDFIEDHGLQTHRMFKFFTDMSPKQMEAMLDSWELSQKVISSDIEAYATFGFTKSELEELDKLVNRKGVSEALKKKLGSLTTEVLKQKEA